MPHKRRFDEGGPGSLEEATRRPDNVRRPTWTREFERAVLDVRQLTGWGKDKLVVLLRQDGWECSTSMVGRVLRKLKQTGKLVEYRLKTANTIAEVQRLLRTWEEVHNQFRPHQALGQITPLAFLKHCA